MATDWLEEYIKECQHLREVIVERNVELVKAEERLDGYQARLRDAVVALLGVIHIAEYHCDRCYDVPPYYRDNLDRAKSVLAKETGR